jgi:ABC-type transporter Mla MlaB component
MSRQDSVYSQDEDIYHLSGAIDFSTAPEQLRQASVYISTFSDRSTSAEGDRDIAIDLSEVTVCNSAALALVLEIAKDAGNNNLKIHFNHMPETLLTIAKAYGAESEFREITQ